MAKRIRRSIGFLLIMSLVLAIGLSLIVYDGGYADNDPAPPAPYCPPTGIPDPPD